MQAQVVRLDQNHLTGTIPLWANISVLNATSNRLSNQTFAALPASLKLLYLANNSFSGPFPDHAMLPVNLTVLDVSYNSLSGELPQALPANLSVLNASENLLTGSLPSNWSRLVELRLDNMDLSGKLPAKWSEWGGNTSNSIQLSLVSSGLGGSMPQQWVKQFCLAVVQDTDKQVLFDPTTLALNFYQYDIAHNNRQEEVLVPVGSQIAIVAQHASINVTLKGKRYTFSYQDPGSICRIPL